MSQIKFLNTMNCLTKRIRTLLFSNYYYFSKYSYTINGNIEVPATVKKEDTNSGKQSFIKELDTTTVALPLPIFSRKGDFGKTEINGVKMSKDDKIFHAIGATDELSAQLGFAKEFGRQHAYGDKLLRIQILLVNVISVIQKSGIKEKITFSPSYTKELEDWIDEYSNELPPSPVEHCVLPGGGIASSALHVARATCRRAERKVIPLVQDGVIDQEILAYLNRLSDFLLTVSRFACKMDKQDEYTTCSHHDSAKK